VAVAGEVLNKNYVAAVDELGNVVVWRIVLKGNGLYHKRIIYHYQCDDEDPIETLAFRRAVLVCGHASGNLTFHQVSQGIKYAEIQTNTRRITALEVYRDVNWVVVGGEDCRLSVLQIPVPETDDRTSLLFSLCLNAAVLGATFTSLDEKSPSFMLTLFDMPYLISYAYDLDAAAERFAMQKLSTSGVDRDSARHSVAPSSYPLSETLSMVPSEVPSAVPPNAATEVAERRNGTAEGRVNGGDGAPSKEGESGEKN